MNNNAPLTRAKVDAEPGAAKYLRETHLMQDWPDKMLDIVLNGPTCNGVNKDEIRGMLRQTYGALKRYEQIGPMASPFANDPNAIVARAFAELHPGLEYHAQLVPELKDDEGNEVYAETVFPVDGCTPVISISAVAPISAGPELLAHELAHVATPGDDHGEAWQTAEAAIFEKYNEILDATISAPALEVNVTPHKPGDGGILAMPLKANIPEPREDWTLTSCPICGAECWQSQIARETLAAEPDLSAACTACALKAGTIKGGRHE